MSGVLVTETRRDIESMTLDEIMALPEPQKTDVIEQWLNPDLSVQDDGATLKAFNAEGKCINWSVKMHDGTEIKFGPRGRNFSRKLAYVIMQRWGKKGRYHGIHQATGMRKRSDMAQWTAMQKEDFKNAKPNTNYLSHVLKQGDLDGGSEDIIVPDAAS